MSLNIQNLKNDLKIMIADYEKEALCLIKDNEFLEAFEKQNAKEALLELDDRIIVLDSEETILESIEKLLKEYDNHIKTNKKVHNAFYCKVCSDKIREIEDNVLNEIRQGTYD